MANRKEILSFLDNFLDIHTFTDKSPNGLQVIGKDTIERIALGVSLSQELIEKSIASSADMIIVHHGLFWGESKIDNPLLRKRLKLLLDKDMNLAAYHLPLDAHKEIGNNISLCKILHLDFDCMFGNVNGKYIGVMATTKMPFDDLIKVIMKELKVKPRYWQNCAPSRICIVSGRGSGLLDQAVSNCDTFITGELLENPPAIAKEANMNLIFLGHYNSEKLGVINLGKELERKFGVETFFIDIPNDI
jgi:dinuclear metal center YbgI/SA1388 family protein